MFLKNETFFYFYLNMLRIHSSSPPPLSTGYVKFSSLAILEYLIFRSLLAFLSTFFFFEVNVGLMLRDFDHVRTRLL